MSDSHSVTTHFSPRARVQAMLDVEGALALAEASLGIIPAEAGPAIAE
jgi:adenylosuccinate lyase